MYTSVYRSSLAEGTDIHQRNSALRDARFVAASSRDSVVCHYVHDSEFRPSAECLLPTAAEVPEALLRNEWSVRAGVPSCQTRFVL
jgi:hypothetical protein